MAIIEARFEVRGFQFTAQELRDISRFLTLAQDGVNYKVDFLKKHYLNNVSVDTQKALTKSPSMQKAFEAGLFNSARKGEIFLRPEYRNIVMRARSRGGEL